MRYQNWDVLVFPDECKVPLQEFKTNCQVIQDPELHSMQLNPFLLPTVTCFIPGLPADSPFRISIHSWQNPEISRHIQGLRKPTDHVVFEARLFIDGSISGSKYFDDDGPWPSVIELSLDLDKRGDFERLRFPMFHKELLSQSYWNAGDDLGRIKVVISEGFTRDTLTFPFERIKNVASFSFQHAPLDVLETSSIAWPNAAMWRQVSLLEPYYTQHTSPRVDGENPDAHTHSPRKALVAARLPLHASTSGSAHLVNAPSFPIQPVHDPFTEPVRPAFKGYRQPSDTSMEGCSSANTRSNSSRHVTDPMVLCDKQDRRLETMQSAGAYASLCEALNRPSTMPPGPTNTPQNAEYGIGTVARSRVASISAIIGSIPAKVEREQIVNYNAPLAGPVINNVSSRKENLHSSPHAELTPITAEGGPRKSSQPFAATNSSGSKRQRVITPAASKVIDAEDEPRTSPSSRKVSHASTTQENETERKALIGIQNV